VKKQYFCGYGIFVEIVGTGCRRNVTTAWYREAYGPSACVAFAEATQGANGIFVARTDKHAGRHTLLQQLQ
jgi:hypothetical protein